MKKQIFKYKGISYCVFIFGFVFLLFCGFGIFDIYYLFKGEGNSLVFGHYLALVFLIFIFLLCIISLILVSLKSSKSITVLNVFYGCLIFLFLLLAIGNLFSKDKDVTKAELIIILGFNFIVIFLIYLINRYKCVRMNYENMDTIGKNTD